MAYELGIILPHKTRPDRHDRGGRTAPPLQPASLWRDRIGQARPGHRSAPNRRNVSTSPTASTRPSLRAGTRRSDRCARRLAHEVDAAIGGHRQPLAARSSPAPRDRPTHRPARRSTGPTPCRRGADAARRPEAAMRTRISSTSSIANIAPDLRKLSFEKRRQFRCAHRDAHAFLPTRFVPQWPYTMEETRWQFSTAATKGRSRA